MARAEGDNNMCPRSFQRLSGLGLIVASLAIVGLGIAAWRQARVSKQLAIETRSDELQAILSGLREAKSERTLGEHWTSFQGWMAKNVVRGRTRRADIVACFGRDQQDLDRPPRDGVETMEYLLYGDRVNGTMVFFDFDPKKGILQEWQISSSICGYCPHILASDGQWRLEGKMLAGRIGSDREGPDSLLLPRLVPKDQEFRVRLANWAPEVEYIDQVQLAVVPCDSGWEVDLDGEGQPYVWKEVRSAELRPARQDAGCDRWMLSVGGPEAGRVIVLEARNTGEFERAMRMVVFKSEAPWRRANLTLSFDDGGCQELLPVGTKFLRRMVVPVPPHAGTLQISSPSDMWLVRRAWLGHGHVAQDVAWLSATDATGHEGDVLGILRDYDKARLVLAPMQEVELGFIAPAAVSDDLHHRFVLRLCGYYELLP